MASVMPSPRKSQTPSTARLSITDDAAAFPADELRAVVETAPDGMFVVAAGGAIEFANAAAARMFGYEIDELVGHPIEILVPAAARGAHASYRDGFVHQPKTRPMGTGLELRGVRADGTEFPVEISLSPLAHGDAMHVIAVVRDVTERHAIETALAQSHQRLEQQRRHLAVASDRERIAMDLHDGVIQSLYSIGMRLNAVERSTANQEQSGEIGRAVDEIDRVIEDIRSYIHALQPGILADWQLERAVEQLVEDLRHRAPIDVTVEIDPDAAARLAWCVGDLVQVTRESLSNIARHSGATTAAVRLWSDGDGAHFEIADNGKGFDPAIAIGSGLGLVNLRKRVAPLAGEIDIVSEPGNGTRIHLRFDI